MEKTTILYVEDEPFLGRIVKESLESRAYNVHMVADGGDAVAAFLEVRPSVVVLDVMLPSKDGYTIATELRNINSTVPIIFVTARVQTEDVVKGFRSGANDYIRKPFSMEELIVRINNVLTHVPGSRSQTADYRQLGKYQFNPQLFELKFNGQTRKLSHREVTLLLMLADHKNETVFRKDILMKLWGDDSYFNSRNLDVYITKLREYLKQDARIRIITIKGVGYQFAIE